MNNVLHFAAHWDVLMARGLPLPRDRNKSAELHKSTSRDRLKSRQDGGRRVMAIIALQEMSACLFLIDKLHPGG